MNFKRLISCVLILSMLCSCFAFAQETAVNTDTQSAAPETTPVLTQAEINKNATGFTDVLPDAPYVNALKKLVEYGIIKGYPDGTFKPDGDVTRAEMCKMINLTRGFTDFEGAVGFADVTNKNWYYTYALAAQKQGYIVGYPIKDSTQTTFGGGNNITRQEVCTILCRILKPMNLGIPVTITDKVANWARPDVELIVQNFIMPLEANNTFRATENLKRHELATIMANLAIGPVTPMTADVRFYVNGVQYGETQTVEIGNCAKLPENPKSENPSLEFYGWRPVGTQDAIEVDTAIVTGSVDYEAVFVEITHTVTFYSRGAEYDVQTVVHNKIPTAPENPEAKGYDFVGWSLAENGLAVKLSTMQITSDTSFYAVFEKADSEGGGAGEEEVKKFNVKFFVNGDIYEQQKIEKGKYPAKVSDPSIDGYDFVGWSTSKDGEIVNPTKQKITANTTFYAVFEKEKEPEPESYSVVFYSDGKVVDEQIVLHGYSASAPLSPSKDGYTFKGWSKSEGGTIVTVGYYSVTGDTEFYAVFEKKAEEIKYHTVKFYVDNSIYSDSEVANGEYAKAPTNPKKDGYVFKGWSKTAVGAVVNVSTVKITENTSFYAIFEKELVYHKVTFYVDGSAVSDSQVLSGEYAKEPTEPKKNGYTFVGWSKTSSGSVVDVADVKITENTSFYAIFEKDIVYYTVTFYVDNSEYSDSKVVSGEYAAAPADPKKNGYVFVGWARTASGSVVDVENVKITANISFCAVFEKEEEEPVYCTVTFYVDSDVHSEQTVLKNGKCVAPKNPSKDGYTFNGWSRTKGGSVVSVSGIIITSDTSFYAVFEKDKEPEPEYFTVTFYCDGEVHDSFEVIDGDYPDLPEEPYLDGYVFLGWSKTENGRLVEPDSIAVTADTEYYAVFEEEEEEIVYYNVMFWFDGEVILKLEVAEGDTVSAPKTPELDDGVTFHGWAYKYESDDKDDVIEVSDIVIEEHTDFYAVLSKNPNDPELMEKLERGYSQLGKIRVAGIHKETINVIRDCMGYVIEDANNGEFIDEMYIRRNYGDEVEQVRVLVNETMTTEERSNFVNLLTNPSKIDKDVQDFLIDYFNIDTAI